MGLNESKLTTLPAPHRPGTYRTLSLYMATFNVADQSPCDDDLTDFCGLSVASSTLSTATTTSTTPSTNSIRLTKTFNFADKRNDLPDIIALGLQEQQSHEEWLKTMKCRLVSNGYCAIKFRKLWAMSLVVFSKLEHLEAVQNIESEVTRSGVADILGDKGAVSIRFDIYGINLILVCAHLSAHLHENKERISDFWDIVSHQKFRDPDVDKILDHDFIFWMGDLNFRIENIPKHMVEDTIAKGQAISLLENDQLKSTIVDSGIFDEFEEGPITFNPTFKFDLLSDQYDTSKKQRIPAWTDRILYKTNQTKLCEKNLKIKLVQYDSLPQYKFSDHRPVFARFMLTVPGTPPLLPVQFIDWKVKRKEKHTCTQALVRYRLTRRADPKFAPRMTDCIRLFKLPFTDFDDIVVQAPAATADCGLPVQVLQVKLRLTIDLVNVNDWLMLVYWSTKKNCPATCSPLFQWKSVEM